MSTFKTGHSSWTATDGRRIFLITRGGGVYVVTDATTREVVGSVDHLDDIEYL